MPARAFRSELACAAMEVSMRILTALSILAQVRPSPEERTSRLVRKAPRRTKSKWPRGNKLARRVARNAARMRGEL